MLSITYLHRLAPNEPKNRPPFATIQTESHQRKRRPLPSQRQTRNAERETPGPGRSHEAKNMPVRGNKLRIDTQSRDSNGAVSEPSAYLGIRNGEDRETKCGQETKAGDMRRGARLQPCRHPWRHVFARTTSKPLPPPGQPIRQRQKAHEIPRTTPILTGA